MPRWRRVLFRRTGALGLALTAYEIWLRIPPKQRRQILEQTRKHGPRIARQMIERRRRRRRGL